MEAAGTKKFVITDLGENNVELPPNYSTDIEGEYKSTNLTNEPKEKYKLAVECKYAKIYKKRSKYKKSINHNI